MTKTYDEWAPIFVDLLIKDFRLSVDDASAIVGNGGHESGGFEALQEKNPTVKGSRGGYGYYQWTGIRRKAYENYCHRNGLNPAAPMSNYKFLFVELSGSEGKVLLLLRAAEGLEAKTKLFSDRFLRPGIPHYASRYKWARRAKELYLGRDNTPQVPEPVASSPEPAYNPAISWVRRLWDWLKRWFS